MFASKFKSKPPSELMKTNHRAQSGKQSKAWKIVELVMSNWDQNVKDLATTVLELPPSCVEFSLKHPDFFVVGTYNLQKEEANADVEEKDGSKRAQSRNGSLVLFKVQDEKLKLVSKVEHHAAILDLHFCPEHHSSRDMFLLANSVGQVSLYELDMTSAPKIVCLKDFSVSSADTLILSCAWHPCFPGVVGVTLSTGTATVLKFNKDWTEVEKIHEDINHHSNEFMSLECWTLAFSPSGMDPLIAQEYPQNLYTGGDDNMLRYTEFQYVKNLEKPLEEIATTAPNGLAAIGGHRAGVTAILVLPLGLEGGTEILITGSYDDHVRVYALFDHHPPHSPLHPVVLAEVPLGGGVWRLKLINADVQNPEPYDMNRVHRFLVLASCMHAGVKIFEVKGSIGGRWNIQILARFRGHKSMNYASDVQPVTPKKSERVKAICVSTSFYDRRLRLWEFNDVEGQ